MIYRVIILAFLTLVLGGCQEKHLIYVHDMNLGIVVTPLTSGGTSKLSVGFDRETFALAPRKTEAKGKDGADAMSMTAISKVKAVGLEKIQFSHLIATGDAASMVIEDGDKLGKSVENVFNGGEND
ncbi:MAG: hypothetical protein ACYTDW_06350 [Planctomycetota bacterium]|jgi:hypothetical protein